MLKMKKEADANAYIRFMSILHNLFKTFRRSRNKKGKMGPIRLKDGSVTHDDALKAKTFKLESTD